ncbi:hypothetical protein EVAR_89781_1 [Eumeta japonica]|uniref:Uncharacterized protein n=1 Tax=Eumeta variegata TaxID=151549 RepID=A0A4C1XFY4_EUMVA|nr:hypothetical protein EVAR_89781_1 [Eumeta japonica]
MLFWLRVKTDLMRIFVLGVFTLDMSKPLEEREEFWTNVRFLRSTYGEPRKDRCRNSDVRERCGLREDVVATVERVMVHGIESRARSRQPADATKVLRGDHARLGNVLLMLDNETLVALDY